MCIAIADSQVMASWMRSEIGFPISSVTRSSPSLCVQICIHLLSGCHFSFPFFFPTLGKRQSSRETWTHVRLHPMYAPSDCLNHSSSGGSPSHDSPSLHRKSLPAFQSDSPSLTVFSSRSVSFSLRMQTTNIHQTKYTKIVPLSFATPRKSQRAERVIT